MDTVMAWVLGVATILGGIAAILYFRDQWKGRNRLTEEDKEVTSAWWEASDIRKDYEAKGYRSFSWSNSDQVAERQVEGAEIIYLIDDERKVKFKLVNRSGQILIGRKGT
jgi:hypothetical protein